MSSRITPEFRRQFSRILAAKGYGKGEHFKELLGCISEHNLSYTLDEVPCKYFLTHKANRGGLMLSPFNAHSNAGGVSDHGADRKELKNAFATELAPSGHPQRDEQIAANHKLIVRSGGLLAPINNEERYCTVGTGHMTAFCKHAVLPHANTTSKTLEFPDSMEVDLLKLKRNT